VDGVDGDMSQLAPYGTWRSPVSAREVAEAVELGPVVFAEDATVWWQEIRPGEDGRSYLMRRSPSGETTEAPTPEGASHWLPVTDGVVMTGNEDHRLYLLRAGSPPRPLTPERTGEQDDIYTDFVPGPDRREIWCVREPQHDNMAARQIVAVPLDGTCAVRSLLTTTRFVTTPRPSPNGTLLAWVVWDKPQMPWDGSELQVGQVTPEGVIDTHTVLGGPVESVSQPRWASTASLYAVSDRSRWWNLYQVWLDGTLRPLCPWLEEFGWPDPAQTTYGELSNESLAVLHGTGDWRLDLLDPNDGTVTPLDLPYTGWQPGLATRGSAIVGVAGSVTNPAAVVVVDAATGKHQTLRRSVPELLPSTCRRQPRRRSPDVTDIRCTP
jgi:hypothetical protein